MTKELAGRIAFVTGSGRGLGFTMANRLAELGADVAIHDMDWKAPSKYGEAADLDAVAERLARHGGRVAAVAGNIGDREAVARMIDLIAPRHGLTAADAYMLCSVCGDLRISEIVDAPNWVVSFYFPRIVFE